MIPNVPGESELALLHGLVTDPAKLTAALKKISDHREAEEKRLAVRVTEAEAAIARANTEAGSIIAAAKQAKADADADREKAKTILANANLQWGSMREEARALMGEAMERRTEVEKASREVERQRQANLAEAARLKTEVAEFEARRQRLAAAL